MSYATIIIPVITFNPTSSDEDCVIGMIQLGADSDPRVTVSAAENAVVVAIDGNISTPLDLCFQVVDETGANTSYTVQFISFNGTQFMPDGTSGNTVTVTDVLSATGLWEYSIVITQNSTGQSGLIDPPIENDE